MASDTRELVLRAALELDYQPSSAARNLRRGRTDRIGLFLNTSIEYVVDYLSGIIPGVVRHSQRCDKRLLIYTLTDNDPGQLLQVCRAGEIDGVILFSTHYDSHTIETLLAENFPFVVMGRQIPDEQLIVETRLQPESGVAATRQLLALPQRPTAIFAFHDLAAVDVINVVQQAGLQVPRDMAVMGFDGLRAGFRTVPHISTVQQPLERIGDGDYAVTGGWGHLLATHSDVDWLGLTPTGVVVHMRVMDFYRCDTDDASVTSLREDRVPIDIPHVLLQMGVDVFGRMRHQHRQAGAISASDFLLRN